MKNSILFIFLLNNISIGAQSAQIELKIDAYKDRIGQLDVLILSAKLFNLNNEMVEINDPQNTWFEYRKLGVKEWITTPSLDAISGMGKTSEPGTIYIQAKNTYDFNIGAAFYTSKSNNENGDFQWTYSALGKYEIRLAYAISSDEKPVVIYSNIINCEIIGYQGINAKAFKYLSQQSFPPFLNDAYFFGANWQLASNRMNIKEICHQIMNDFPNSKFATWVKLNLIEMEIYTFSPLIDKIALKEKIVEFKEIKNPFIQERILFLLNYIEKH